MLTSSKVFTSPSCAMRRSRYVPDVSKEAVVDRVEALPNVTVPGPLTLLQLVVTAPGGLGRLSSLAVPARLALAGSVIVASLPAFTVGPIFGVCNVTLVNVPVPEPLLVFVRELDQQSPALTVPENVMVPSWVHVLPSAL